MRFTFVAQDPKGATVKGDMDAKDRREAADFLLSKGLTPLSLTLVAETQRRTQSRMKMFLAGSLTPFDQVIITRHLGTILGAGTDLLSALSIIADDAPKPLIKNIMRDVKSRVATGETFSGALGAWHTYFDQIFLSLVKAGESSGNLAKVLQDYSKELRKDYTFQRKVKGAMFYPFILMSALGGMMLLMLLVVVPKLKELFRATGSPPPWYSKIMFSASDILHQDMLLLAILFIVMVIFLFVALRQPRMKQFLSNILWHIPYLSVIQKNSTLLHFAKTLASLIKAGFNLKQALVITAEAVGPRYGASLKQIGEVKLERGISFADSLKDYPKLYPPILISLVSTGEKSGQLEGVLEQMAEFYEEEVIYALEQFLTFIEPMLIVVVGIIVGLMAGSLISPIYRFIGKF